MELSNNKYSESLNSHYTKIKRGRFILVDSAKVNTILGYEFLNEQKAGV